MTDASLEDELVASGRYARLDIAPAPGDAGAGAAWSRVVVGFVERPDGSLAVAAGAGAAWAERLRASGRARLTVAERSVEVVAEEVAAAEHAAVIRELILRYGTPAERLGSGPAFALRPVGDVPSAASRSSR